MRAPYTSGGVATIVDLTRENSRVTPTDATAYVQFNTDGTTTLSTVSSGGSTAGANWVSKPAVAGGSWEIKADVVSGAVGAGSSSTGAWLAMSSVRSWNVIRTSDVAGTTECVIDVSIRRVGGSFTKVARYTLRATVTV